jgi:hypothetical protein
LFIADREEVNRRLHVLCRAIIVVSVRLFVLFVSLWAVCCILFKNQKNEIFWCASFMSTTLCTNAMPMNKQSYNSTLTVPSINVVLANEDLVRYIVGFIALNDRVVFRMTSRFMDKATNTSIRFGIIQIKKNEPTGYDVLHLFNHVPRTQLCVEITGNGMIPESEQPLLANLHHLNLRSTLISSGSCPGQLTFESILLYIHKYYIRVLTTVV